MKKYFLFLIILFLIPFTIAFTKNDSGYEVTFLVSSGQSLTINNLYVSGTHEGLGVGNYTNNNITIEQGILYLLPEDVEEVIAVILNITGPNGGGSVPLRIKASTIYYDVIIEVENNK